MCVRIQQLAFHFYHGHFSILRSVNCERWTWAFYSILSTFFDFYSSLNVKRTQSDNASFELISIFVLKKCKNQNHGRRVYLWIFHILIFHSILFFLSTDYSKHPCKTRNSNFTQCEHIILLNVLTQRYRCD